MPRFQLFRVRVEAPDQPVLDDDRAPKPALLARALEEFPAYRPPRGAQWRVGDLEHLGEGAYHFTIGKITKATVGAWDDQRKGFVELENQPASYTHGFVDTHRELAALAHNVAVDTRVTNIGRRFAGLLNSTSPATDLGYTFHVSAVPNPVGFIEQIRKAHRVTKFEFRVATRNFFDAGEVQETLERTVEEFGGDEGKFVTESDELDKEKVEKQSREVAQSGQDATAWIEPTPGDRKTPIKMSGTYVNVEVEQIDSDEARRGAWAQFVARYKAISSGHDEEA